MNTTLTFTAAFAALVSSATANTWFEPVPADRMRGLSADRPDATESPVTVDAGHVQIEASVFDWSREGRDDSFTVMETNLKLGLTERTDIQFVWESYRFENPAGPGNGAEGFGDVSVRWKWNLWGNDGGDTALALFPFVTIPSGTEVGSDEWQGGLIIPFSMSLGERLGLGLMAEIDCVDDGSGGHDFEFVHTAVLGVDLTDRWGCFGEYIGVLGEHRYEASLAGGLTWSLTENLMLDAGGRIGLNGHAEDVGLFSGFTVRY